MPNQMRQFHLLLFIFLTNTAFSQVLLDADGPGDTYSLITSVLAPGHNPIEVPDCNHLDFGDHIDEVFDTDLNTNVFRFYIHTNEDDDRCINFDRQRNEIKSYSQSPDNLLGIEGEKVLYKWKFKLAEGFQSSPNFTHLHQLKAVGGPFSSTPMYTLTARKSTPDRIELRHAATNDQETLTQAPLAPFIGSWLEVTETIKYGFLGTYSIEIKNVSDGTILLDYSNNTIINWREGTDFVRPKWGIYRSLDNQQDLRDEAVLFANFSIEELETVATEEIFNNTFPLSIFPNPTHNSLQLSSLSPNANLIKIYSLDGRKILEKKIDSKINLRVDVSSFLNGTYLINISGEGLSQSRIFVKSEK